MGRYPSTKNEKTAEIEMKQFLVGRKFYKKKRQWSPYSAS